ncbi:hypothetical protein FWK35_00031809 [Aphis craccivora]|uniref:Uncharacterized protein n=1 Tax=Aphis craccivora TaxID=307492 RepID=A0A6G0VZL9_APHCR|nr:hypothetical protein FWK35_00031809 [Aphis craccivora]
MADNTGSSQVAGPSTSADPEPPLDRDDSDSDSMSDCGGPCKVSLGSLPSVGNPHTKAVRSPCGTLYQQKSIDRTTTALLVLG